MLPIPSRLAAFALFGCAGLVFLGVVTNAPVPVMLGGGGLLGLCLALALTLPIGARLRRHRVELARWLAHGQPGQQSAGAIAGAVFEVRCYIQNHSGEPITLCDLLPVVPDGVSLLTDGGIAPALRGGASGGIAPALRGGASGANATVRVPANTRAEPAFE